MDAAKFFAPSSPGIVVIKTSFLLTPRWSDKLECLSSGPLVYCLKIRPANGSVIYDCKTFIVQWLVL